MKKLNILAVIILVIFAAGFRGCGDDGVFDGIWSKKNGVKTNAQVQVYSENKVNRALFPEIDKGIENLKVTAALEGYQPLTHPEFVVSLYPTSPKCINPGFLVRDFSNTWDNLPPPNDFDKDPKVGSTLLCAAGMHPGENVMIVADNFGHMALIIEYEGEHATLLRRDPDRWVATSGVHAHPIFRQSAAFVSKEYQAIILELTQDIEGDGFALKKGHKICVLVTR